MLGFEQWVTEDVRVGGHGDVFFCGHGFPDLVEEGAVVDAHGRGYAGAEAGPVLREKGIVRGVGGMFVGSMADFGIIALGPLKEGSIKAKVVCMRH